MMEVCRRAGDFTASPSHHQTAPSAQPSSTSLVTNFHVPTSSGTAVTLTFNNQVQRLVRDHRSTQPTYDSIYHIYRPDNSRRASQYNGTSSNSTNNRSGVHDFSHQLVPGILCPPPGYQTMPSPTKHVVVAQPTQGQQNSLQIQSSLISQQQAVAAAAAAAATQQYTVPVSMVETGRQMLLTVSFSSRFFFFFILVVALTSVVLVSKLKKKKLNV